MSKSLFLLSLTALLAFVACEKKDTKDAAKKDGVVAEAAAKPLDKKDEKAAASSSHAAHAKDASATPATAPAAPAKDAADATASSTTPAQSGASK